MQNLAFGGRMAAGKTTAAWFLAAVAGYELLSLAGPLKELADVNASAEGQEGVRAHVAAWADGYRLHTYLSSDLGSFMDEAVAAIQQFDGRRRLQVLGTEIGRRYRPTLWVDLLLDRVRSRPAVRVVVDDVRFVNEVQLLRENGFHTIFLEVTRTSQRERLLHRDGAVDPEAMQHASEQETLAAREFFHEVWPEETPAGRYTRLVNRFVPDYVKASAYLSGTLVGVEPC